MSQKCIKCGSYAININHHGRKPNEDTDLCDVCYWRKRAGGFEDFSKKTNYEKIKNMSIEEMTEWMYIHTNCFECETEGSGLHCISQCKDVMRKYLESEAK